MARDTQMKLVYAWERQAMPGMLAPERSLTQSAVVKLIRTVHEDINRSGGHAAETQSVKFSRRRTKVVGCGRWGAMSFNPDKATPELVLHEIAHSLTWANPMMQFCHSTSRLWAQEPRMNHASKTHCAMGHGPRYVACYIALLERYAGQNVDWLLSSARSVTFKTLGPKTYEKRDDGRIWWTRKPVERTSRVVVNLEALAYWRSLLSNNHSVAA